MHTTVLLVALARARCEIAQVVVQDRTEFGGSRVRGVGELIAVEQIKNAVQAVIRVTVEIEGEGRPACVVDTISRYYPA